MPHPFADVGGSPYISGAFESAGHEEKPGFAKGGATFRPWPGFLFGALVSKPAAADGVRRTRLQGRQSRDLVASRASLFSPLDTPVERIFRGAERCQNRRISMI